MRRRNRSHRIRTKSRGGVRRDPRLCSFSAVFQPFSSRIDVGTVVGSGLGCRADCSAALDADACNIASESSDANFSIEGNRRFRRSPSRQTARSHVVPCGPSLMRTPSAVSSSRTRSLSAQSFAARAAFRRSSSSSTMPRAGSSAGASPRNLHVRRSPVRRDCIRAASSAPSERHRMDETGRDARRSGSRVQRSLRRTMRKEAPRRRIPRSSATHSDAACGGDEHDSPQGRPYPSMHPRHPAYRGAVGSPMLRPASSTTASNSISGRIGTPHRRCPKATRTASVAHRIPRAMTDESESRLRSRARSRFGSRAHTRAHTRARSRFRSKFRSRSCPQTASSSSGRSAARAKFAMPAAHVPHPSVRDERPREGVREVSVHRFERLAAESRVCTLDS